MKLINDELVYLTNENEHNTIEFYIGTILGVTNVGDCGIIDAESF